MSLQDLASGLPTSHDKRLSVDYIPNWEDHFLSYATMEVDVELEEQVRSLKENVRRILVDPVGSDLQLLQLVDDIQRLGVAYHFESEIDEILKQIHRSYSFDGDGDLYTTSLCFRLLRQQGYKISCDAFNKFKKRNDFEKSIQNDVAGLLSLYEATHLMIHGEDILEEALVFTTTHLKSMKESLSPTLWNQVSHSLNQPLRKGVTRVEARHYISVYEDYVSHNKTLLTLAKLDFNLLQKLHQKELCDLTRWWKNLDVKNKMPFARDRLAQAYFIWVLSVYFEPQFSFARRTSCKVTALFSIMDDIYDNHAGIEDLELFTDAIQRWDMRATDPLSEYMKVFYNAMLGVHTEIEEELAKEGNVYRICYVIEAIKRQATNYFVESKVKVQQKQILTMAEYMKISVPSTGYYPMIATSFVGMGDFASQASFDWLATYPKALQGAELVCRLMDDIADYENELELGTDTSAVECYMREYGATKEKAIIALRRKISDAWKDINESFFLPNAPSRPLLTRILNFACAMDVSYKCEDGYSLHGKLFYDCILPTLVESVPLNP